MNPLRDAIGRTLLVPALRLMREQLKRMDDPLLLRQAARRIDALGRAEPGVRTQPVQAGAVPATWIDVDGAAPDRVLLYLHGGAFVTETPVFHGALLARLCRHARARGLMPGYRLAPEHRYPAALDDCLAAYRWLLEQGVDARRIVVAGDSAGGNLALALLLRARDEGLPLPCGAAVLSPLTDLTFSGDSVQRNDGVDDMFSASSMEALIPVYLDDPALRRHPRVSPLFGDFTGLPPLLLVVGSTELLLDDSVRVAQRWPRAQLRVWHGMPHVFPGFDFLPEARAATQQIGRFVGGCLGAAAAASVAAPASPAVEPPDAAAEAPDAQAAPAPPPPDRLAWAYLALAVIAGALWLGLAVLLPGSTLALASPLVWVSSVVILTIMVIEAGAVGWPRILWCLLAGALLGPGCGLALFLYLRATSAGRHLGLAGRRA